MTEIVNQALESINLQIINEIRWEKYLSKRHNTEDIAFGTFHQPIIVKSAAEIGRLVEQTMFIDVREVKQNLEKKEDR